MNKILSKSLFLLIFLSSILFNNPVYSKDNIKEQVIEEKNYAKENIGSYYKFKEDMVYLELNDSPTDAVYKENGAMFLLTRASIAKILTKTKTFPIQQPSSFKLLKVFKTVYVNLDDWEQGSKDLYLSTKKVSPAIDMYFLFEDSNGTKFITMSGTFRKAEIVSQ